MIIPTVLSGTGAHYTTCGLRHAVHHAVHGSLVRSQAEGETGLETTAPTRGGAHDAAGRRTNRLSRESPETQRRRSAWGRVGGLTTRSRLSGDAMTRAARRGFLVRFERQVDPMGVLTPAERTRRAEAAMRVHMLRLAERSAAARAGRRDRAPRTPEPERLGSMPESTAARDPIHRR